MKSNRSQILTSLNEANTTRELSGAVIGGLLSCSPIKVYSLPNTNGPGNSFLSEKVLQSLAAEKGRILSRAGELPEIVIVQVTTEAEGTVVLKESAASV